MRKVPVEVYSRCVGYYRPVNQWNPGKQQEFRERKEYKLREEDLYDNREKRNTK
jgi:ribonucleoside-triphosphate reductase